MYLHTHILTAKKYHTPTFLFAYIHKWWDWGIFCIPYKFNLIFPNNLAQYLALSSHQLPSPVEWCKDQPGALCFLDQQLMDTVLCCAVTLGRQRFGSSSKLSFLPLGDLWSSYSHGGKYIQQSKILPLDSHWIMRTRNIIFTRKPLNAPYRLSCYSRFWHFSKRISFLNPRRCNGC